jgi:ADP-ribose pyrophosphatase
MTNQIAPNTEPDPGTSGSDVGHAPPPQPDEGDTSLRETITGSELVYDGRIVHLYKETVELPDGKTAVREIIHHVGAVAVIPIAPDGKIVLVRQYRLAARRVMLELPAGTLNPGEAPETCAIRECQEEVGYKPGNLEAIGGVFVAPGYSTEYIHFFVATDLTRSVLDADADEFLKVEHLSEAQVLDAVIQRVIVDAKTISAFMMWQARKA